jgi:hypothetical protein
MSNESVVIVGAGGGPFDSKQGLSENRNALGTSPMADNDELLRLPTWGDRYSVAKKPNLCMIANIAG